MIPKRIRDKAYREKRKRQSQTCDIVQEHNQYVVYLDDKKLVLGRAKVNR